ncbi:hypothetical protein [Nocardioides bizhenqiangii]|uniref:DUF4189 domain-containing protein n=1 Tax=Nocardioides bizhenqiangii TaxID=3095076 RepID=A0ABZ0ZLG9_9ACTN|nr:MULTISPECIES: hypothetical protein [unclassified Nocardioides]MDZ5620803.1 hypothetical protein [Nocardioides sp. HM23]WQQ25167.1 hypothetical protein SHK19_14475 [Nocardioides sp. HM61]
MRSALFVRAVLAVAAAFVLSGTLLAAPATSIPSDRVTVSQVSARAPGCLPRCWVAVGYNSATGRSGWTQPGKWGTKAGAMRSAHAHCRARDVNVGHERACVWPGKRNVYAKNACVAIAKLTRNGTIVQWAVGRAYGPKKAMRLAKRKLDGRGTRTAGFACPPRKF